MDVTSVHVGAETRNALADYRDEKDLHNYDAALRHLLEQAEAYP